MISTPRTDEKAVTHPWVNGEAKYVAVEFARELERENAALKVQIRELIATMEEEGEMDAVRIAELKKENAALRADKERLDWVETNARLTRKVGYLRWSFEGPIADNVRESIDIARGKEAQP